MSKVNNKHIKKYREAFKILNVEKLKWRFDKGEFDHDIEMFLNGDTLEFTLTWKTIPNDIIIMRELINFKCDNKVVRKVRKMWENERAN